MTYARYSLCVTPAPDSDLARLGRHWMGWDMDQATELPFLKVEQLPVTVLSLTARLRRYGFHAPLMAPFRLAEGHSPLHLHHTAQALAAHLEALEFSGLSLSADARHLSLRPIGNIRGIERMRHVVAQVFGEFRAPVSPTAEPTTRRRSELSTAQMKAVIDRRAPPDTQAPEFEFALTERSAQQDASDLRRMLLPILTPNLPRPFYVQAITLCGEDMNGWFRVIQRYALVGSHALRSPEQPAAGAMPPTIPLWS